ncbi:hypothetical protein SAMN05216559_2518 [Halomicrobium zhouii]|uniref:Short C-terminal domain-containing protein n=1 Tax=Halomicrobium zhouii TaxID=767519 RepID=A0A1I6LDQ3_9EURY|nr:hypothetical protein [Halomicrobium zhouii]SFS01585.1 hypothetical protein SAMN05216559_2518 [Halomicrobium zhouii]
MSWFSRNAHWVTLALSLVVGYVIVGFLGVSALALLAGAFGGASPGALLADAAVVVGVAGLLILAEVTLTVAFVVSVVRRLSFPTSDRAAWVFSLLETVLPPIRGLGLSERFAPSLEERERAIKRRYVEGDLSERDFEREMLDLLAEAEPESPLADHTDPLDPHESTRGSDDRGGDSPAPDLLNRKRRRETE